MARQDGQMQRLLRRSWALASVLGHSGVGTEHLLIALAMETESLAGRLLLWQGVTAQELMGQLILARGRGCRCPVLPQGLTTRAKRSIRAAGADAQTEAVLAALLRDGANGACRLLRRCHIDENLLFTQLYEGQCVRREQTMQNVRLLEQFGTDLVEQADRTGTVIGRQREIETVLQILSRKHKNNPALIGEPGVGKTAIVEGVAQYIAAGRVPEALRGKRLFALDLASVIAGTKYRGEFEERVRDIINEVQRAQNIILFIDEMHTLVGAGAAEGAIDAANLLKPALGRGRIQLIGATTLEEYRKFIEKDAALERRFRPVQVREPTQDETREILEGLRPGLEAHHRLPISDGAIEAAVRLSCRYLTDKFLPDKAIDLLDEGAAHAKLALATRSGGTAAESIEAELCGAVRDGAYERAAKLRDRLRGLERPKKSTVTAEDIAAAVSNRTGIPIGTVSMTERQRLCSLEATLSKRVVGQEAAVRAVAEAVRRGRSGLAEEKRPVAAMLFTGPTGVGKTELCKALSEAVFGSERAMIRLDMSEYMEKHAVSRLLGAPPGYVGHDEGGELSERVRRRPYSLVLLDELEKAHRDICGILLQVMEDGVLTDANGRHIDFRNTLLVMTSNLGGDETASVGFGDRATAQQRALRDFFPPEFLGRIDCVAAFHRLGQPELEKIAEHQLAALAQRAERLHLVLQFQPGTAQWLAAGAAKKPSGAREVRHLIQTELEAPLSALLLGADPPERLQIAPEREHLALRS